MHVIQLIRADFSALIKGCVRVGVCGKQPSTAKLRDELVYELIRLAETAREKRSELSDRLIPDGLFTTLTNVNFDDEAIKNFTERVKAERIRLGGYENDRSMSGINGGHMMTTGFAHNAALSKSEFGLLFFRLRLRLIWRMHSDAESMICR